MKAVNINNKQKNKFIILIALFIIQFVFIYAVDFFCWNRIASYELVKTEICSKWGNNQAINDVYIAIANADGKIEKKYFPKMLNAKSELIPEVRHRGIYNIAVFTANVSASATFEPVNGEKRKLIIKISDANGTVSLSGRMNNRELKFSYDAEHKYFVSDIPAEIGAGDMNANFDIVLRGSGSFSFGASGEKNSFKMHSKWGNPKFIGYRLPDTYKIDEKNFTAEWNIDNINKISGLSENVGTEILVSFDSYAKVDRAIGYSFLFLMIFMATLITGEWVSKNKLHILQYAVASCTPVIFYLLLLSTSEFLGFEAGFILCATIATSMISIYTLIAFRSGKSMLIILLSNILSYILMYVILNMQIYALIAGSLVITAGLAIAMCATAKINRNTPEATA